MDNSRCTDATTLLLTALTQEKRARADQQRAVLALAQNYTASMGATIDDELIDSLTEDIAPRGRYGTLPVSEFAGMELGPLMGCSAHQANTIIFETVNLYYRHRCLWDAVQSLNLDAHRARKAAGKFGNLPPEVAERAGRLWVATQHRLGWQGAVDLCDKIIIQLDPETAAMKEAERLNAREVKIWELHEGTINLTAKLDALDAKYVNATVAQIAAILYEKPEYHRVAINVLRAKALGIMAHPAVALSMIQGSLQQPIFGSSAEGNPKDHVIPPLPTGDVIDPDTGRIDRDPHNCWGHACGSVTVAVTKLQPSVQIYIHLDAAAGIDGAAEIEDVGAISIRSLTELLDGKQVRITPVIDLNTIPAEHQYRPSRRLRESILLTFPKEAFPFSNRSSRGLDLDHTVAYQPSSRDPQSRLGNFGPLGRRVHRAKTAGFWKCQQPALGKLVWTSPLGFRYATDRYGTERIG